MNYFNNRNMVVGLMSSSTLPLNVKCSPVATKPKRNSPEINLGHFFFFNLSPRVSASNLLFSVNPSILSLVPCAKKFKFKKTMAFKIFSAEHLKCYAGNRSFLHFSVKNIFFRTIAGCKKDVKNHNYAH